MLEQLIVKPGADANLAGRDPSDTLGLPGKPEANERLKVLLAELSEYQTPLGGRQQERAPDPAGA